MTAVGIFNEGTQEFITALRATTLFISRYELLPEILEIFGEEHFRKFLEIFGGRVMRVPPVKEVTGVLRNIGIWTALSHLDEKVRAQREDMLVEQFGFTRTRLRHIHAAIDDAMSQLGMSLRKKEV